MATPGKFTITLTDGTTLTVQSTLEDRLAFETALRRNRAWGKLQDNGLRMVTWIAWHAAHRTGQTSLSWTEFTTGDTAAFDVTAIDDEPDEPTTLSDVEFEEVEVDGLGKPGPEAVSTGYPSPSPAPGE